MSSIFRHTLNVGGYQASCSQDGGRRTRKVNTLNMYSKHRNSFQTFHLYVGSSIWFRYRMIVLRNLKTTCCSLPSALLAKIQPAFTSFSAGEFHQQLTLSDNCASTWYLLLLHTVHVRIDVTHNDYHVCLVISSTDLFLLSLSGRY